MSTPSEKSSASHDVQVDVRRMFELSAGFVEPRCLWMTAKLGLADLMADGPKTVAELARQVEVNEHGLRRVLRVVAGMGVVEEGKTDEFTLTRLGQLLRKDVAHSMRDWVLMTGQSIYRSFNEALFSLRTGTSAFERVHGKSMYNYFRETPEEAQAFNNAMTSYGGQSAGALEGYDFSWARTVADIGAGPGTVVLSVLKANPHLRGVLFDLPNIVELARERVAQAGLTDRVELVGGSFLEKVPGGDAIILSNVIHNWGDEHARTILRNCRSVISPKGRLVLAEMVIPTGNDPHFCKQTDMVMLVGPGGTERTEAQYAKLLGEAGFKMTKVIPTRYLTSIIEAEPVA